MRANSYIHVVHHSICSAYKRAWNIVGHQNIYCMSEQINKKTAHNLFLQSFVYLYF